MVGTYCYTDSVDLLYTVLLWCLQSNALGQQLNFYVGMLNDKLSHQRVDDTSIGI